MNPFNSSKIRKQMTDALNQVRDANKFEVPDAVTDAAKAAGAEFKASPDKTKETQTNIYKKHWDGLEMPKADAATRDAFNSLANGEAFS